MSRIVRRKSYSVFVGHLPLDVTKGDLWDLFEDSGEINEVYLAVQSPKMCYTYGFVRYKSMEDAKRACADLNGWELKGCKIKVQLAKETTVECNAAERGTLLETRKLPVERSISQSPDVDNADYMAGMKSFSRLRDACGLINLQLEEDPRPGAEPLNMDKLSEDIASETSDRLTARVSKLYDMDMSLETAKAQLHRCRCSKSCTSDTRAEEFLGSLKLMITNIDDFLQKSDKTSNADDSAYASPTRSGHVSESESDTGRKDKHSPSANNSISGTSSSGRAHNTASENSSFRGARPRHKNALSSSEEETGSCGEELSSSLNSSSEATVNKDNMAKSMEIFIHTVLGRGRGLPSLRTVPMPPGTRASVSPSSSPLSAHTESQPLSF